MDLKGMAGSSPRVRKLRGKRILIKFGGNTLNGTGDMERLSGDIALLVSLGLKPIIVHGGGPNISGAMERRGLEVRKVAGLRITDDAAIEVVKEVLVEINDAIVDSLRSTGIRSIGFPGSESGTITCVKKDPVEVVEDGESMLVDLGNVGDVAAIDPAMVSALCASGFVPVIYPICRDSRGREMNVNADTVAAHMAEALGCEELIMVTDVPGVMRGVGVERTIIPEISIDELDELIDEGVITGGMVPKVEACRLAITNGVKRAHMVSGKEPGSILNQLLGGVNCGTTVKMD